MIESFYDGFMDNFSPQNESLEIFDNEDELVDIWIEKINKQNNGESKN